MKAVSYNGDISCTTAVLVDVENLFSKRAMKKNKFKIRTGSRETHNLCWQKDSVEITKSSNVSVPEIIPLDKLQKYANNDLFVNVFSIIKSVNSELWLKEGGYEELAVASTDDIFIKNTFYLAALQNIGITLNNTEEISLFETAPCPLDIFNSNWAQNPWNTQFDLKTEITKKLQKLYMRGKGGGG